MKATLLVLLGAALSTSCTRAALPPPEVKPDAPKPHEPPLPPWQRPDAEPAIAPSVTQTQPILIRQARILIGDGRSIERGHVLLERGKITSVGGGDGRAPDGAEIVDARGKLVTPGLIDTHSHIGVYPLPQAAAHSDGNEATAAVTANVRAIDAFWPQDPAIERAVAGGVSVIQSLPGSANLIGGRALTIKLRRATTASEMRMLDAPVGLKIACGENPKRIYGERKQAPSTRMGNLAGQRAAFWEARRLIEEWKQWRVAEKKRLSELARARAEYEAEVKQRAVRARWCETAPQRLTKPHCDRWRREWEEEELEEPKADDAKLPPARNLGAETLAAALEGQLLVHVHCYRADDMQRMLALADEVGLGIRSFHHALEAYKLRDELARRKISVSTWADWWGFKLEAYDGIPESIALLELSGARPIVHSDSSEGIQRLNQEAAKALWAGRHAGLDVDPARAIRWITLNPAWALGIDQRVGSLEVGKDADLVVWSGDPMSVYAQAERVFIDGIERYERSRASERWSDFEAQP